MLENAGEQAHLLNLYAEGFEPCLGEAERAAYYGPLHLEPDIERHAELLRGAKTLVVVFPTWWFSPPAIMKGWVDRVFAPGIAFDHTPDFGPIVPRLTGLRKTVVITTLGTPWWVDRLAMRRPVRRVLKTAVIGACAPQSRFEYLALYAAEQVAEARIVAFERRIAAALAR